VIDQHARVVLGQLAMAAKASEVHRFTALLDTLTGLDLTGAVIIADALHTQRGHVNLTDVLVTADALHTQRATAEHMVADKNADYIMTIKANQCAPRACRSSSSSSSRGTAAASPRLFAISHY
jgi:predicted transposase YbfD/YdcC